MTSENEYEFDPDWTVHPGGTLRDALRERGMTQLELAWVMGRPVQMVNEICNGKKTITATTALQLEAAGLGKARFWVTAQALYDLDVARGKKVL